MLMSTMSSLNISISICIRKQLMLMHMSRLSSLAHKLLILMFMLMLAYACSWDSRFQDSDLTSKSHGFPPWIATSIRSGLTSTRFKIMFANSLNTNELEGLTVVMFAELVLNLVLISNHSAKFTGKGFLSCVRDSGTRPCGCFKS